MMSNIKKLNIFCLLLMLFIVIFDQASKFSVLAFLPRNACVNIFTGLNMVLIFNFGTSFGLLSPNTVIEYYLVIGIAILCLLFLIYIFCKTKIFSEKILCSLIIGGAIGNLCDRFLHGAVVDFIDVYYKDWHWPAFNIADSFISVSAILLIFTSVFGNSRTQNRFHK